MYHREREAVEVKAEKEISKLHSQSQELNNRLGNEKAAYETLSQIHKEVSSKFLKSIKELVEEKNAKQRLMEQLSEVKSQLEHSEQNRVNKLKKTLYSLQQNFVGRSSSTCRSVVFKA